MKKKILICFLISFLTCQADDQPLDQQIVYLNTLSAAQTYDYSLELCMHIWAELDLLRAIRTSTEDLMYFADKIIDKFFLLHITLAMVKSSHQKEPFQYEDIQNLNDLVRQIDESYYDIFYNIRCKEVACCLVLIERFLESLESFSFTNPT